MLGKILENVYHKLTNNLLRFSQEIIVILQHLDLPKQKRSHKCAQLLLRKVFSKVELTTEIPDRQNKRHNKTVLDPQKTAKFYSKSFHCSL